MCQPRPLCGPAVSGFPFFSYSAHQLFSPRQRAIIIVAIDANDQLAVRRDTARGAARNGRKE